MASHVHMYVSPKLSEAPREATPNRRRAPRHRVRVPVEILQGGHFAGETVDVSRSGLLVETDHPAPTGHVVRLIVETDDGPMRLMGVVVRHVHGEGGALRAVGFTMFGAGTDLRRTWDHFVAGARTAAPVGSTAARASEYVLASARLGGAALEVTEVPTTADDDDLIFDPDAGAADLR